MALIPGESLRLVEPLRCSSSGRPSSSTCRTVCVLFLLWICWVSPGRSVPSTGAMIDQLSPCAAVINGGLINLRPLVKTPEPRLRTAYRSWNYSFNPCLPFDVGSPGEGYGDGCLSVAVCKYGNEAKRSFFYTLGFQTGAKFMLDDTSKEHDDDDDDDEEDDDDIPHVKLVFSGYRSFRNKKTYISLVCDRNRSAPDDAKLTVVQDKGIGDITAELRHLCCCADGCQANAVVKNVTRSHVNNPSMTLTPGSAVYITTSRNMTDETSGDNDTVTGSPMSDTEEILTRPETKKVVIIVCINLGVLVLAGVIGVTCYNRKTHFRFYHKLPGIHSTPQVSLREMSGLRKSGPTVQCHISTTPIGSRILDVEEQNTNAGSLDYETQKSRRKSLTFPVLDHCSIPLELIELGQRLGGSIYGDTYLAEWSGLTVAVKRITLSVHENQFNLDNVKRLQEEVSFLSRQRHRNIVSLLGLCTETKHPYIISEFIKGVPVKDYIKHSGGQLLWPQRVKMLSQVADGMAYLHSTVPPILHRDLRCANMFITDNDIVKVSDFGVVNLTQPIRAMCQEEDCCCQGHHSACPPSIAWTAPEVLEHPNSNESSDYITTASDVYSYAMVMWELVMCEDPFEEIVTVYEVIDTIINGGRPIFPNEDLVFPLYSDLMNDCWDADPKRRPNFKQVTVRLKEVMHQARHFQKLLSSRQKSVTQA